MGKRERWMDDFRGAVSDRSGTSTVPYRLGSRDGHMLAWDRRSDPEPVRLAFPCEGWHEIHVGFMGASGCRARLSGERWFRTLESSVSWTRLPHEGEEAFWKIADLTGRRLELLPLADVDRRADERASRLAYLRLVPLDAAEAEGRLAASRGRPTRTAGAVIDGHGIAMGSRDELCGRLEPFVDSDFRRIYWSFMVTSFRAGYLSKVAAVFGDGQDEERMHSECNRRFARELRKAAEEGWDPMDALIGFARANGIELWASYRIQQDYPPDYPGGVGYEFNSPFSLSHPQWRHVDRQGKVSSHLFSHFHPEWEQYKLDLLAEMAGRGPDGIHLNLMCEEGAIWDWAPRAVAEFQARYGMDPRDGPVPPLEWYRFRCDHLTRFMRRLRRQTNHIAAFLGREIPIAVQVSADWVVLPGGVQAASANFLDGFDIRTWAEEGLVDVIAPSFRRTHAPLFLDHLLEELGPFRDRVELAPSLGQHHNAVYPRGYDWRVYFTDAGKGRHDLLPFGELDAWRVMREANDVYHQGADSVDVWEMGAAPDRLSRWNVLKRIGDRRMLEERFGSLTGPLMGRPERPLVFVLGAATS